MRSLKTLFTAAVLMLGLALAANAGDTTETKTADAPKELKHQTNCPVMGGKIDSTAYTDIQGQRVYHCCPMCTAKLKADPDKYFKEAAAEGILFENIQTTCPISGHKLENKSIYTDFEGRRVVFCSENCKDTFAKEPQKYLKKLDENSTTETKEMKDMKGMDHSEHSGESH